MTVEHAAPGVAAKLRQTAPVARRRRLESDPRALPPAVRGSPGLPTATPATERRGMRFWIMSDLRVDRAPGFRLPDPLPAFDAMLVAGGVMPGIEASLRWLAEALRGRQGDRPVVLVPGPTEFRSDVPLPEALERGRSLARDLGMHLLQDETLRLGFAEAPGTQLVAATLWTDWALEGAFKGQLARIKARHAWPGSERILLRPDRAFSPIDALGAHARSRAYIEDVLAGIAHQATLGCRPPPNPIVQGVRPGDRAVVLTCHAPSGRSLPADWDGWFADTPQAASRASNLEGIMEQWGAPVLWVHGACPAPVDYMIKRTRVVANPGDVPPGGAFDGSCVVCA